MQPSYRDIALDGLWRNNPGLVQLLGLCPLLAVTTTLVNGLGLGLATTLVLVGSNLTVSLVRRLVRREIRIPVFVLVIASLVSTVELAMNAWFHELYRVLGIFIPLIVTNCAIIGRAEAFASRHDPLRSIVDGLTTGFGFLVVLVTLGAAREVIGQGTLLADAHMMFGPAARKLTVDLFGGTGGLPIWYSRKLSESVRRSSRCSMTRWAPSISLPATCWRNWPIRTGPFCRTS